MKIFSGGATIGRGVSGAGSSFRVGGALRGLSCSYWQNFHFSGGDGHWAFIFGGLDMFLIFPNFLRF